MISSIVVSLLSTSTLQLAGTAWGGRGGGGGGGRKGGWADTFTKLTVRPNYGEGLCESVNEANQGKGENANINPRRHCDK
jgi:hypothetical protein